VILRGSNMTNVHAKAIGLAVFRPSHVSVCILLLSVLILLPATGQILAASDFPESPFIAVGRTVRPAVVNIRTIRSVNDEGIGTSPLQEMFRQFFPEEEGKGGRFEMPSTGSGFIVASSGDILTNHHVIASAEAIYVRFSGERREYLATLVGDDPSTDLALIQIDPGDRVLPVLEFADSDKLEVGAWAVAVGNPFGNLESSLTVGVISAKGRNDMVIGGLTPRYQDFIQTDASINFGNSGGPLVNVQGRIIGINTAVNQQGQGIGFAVPSNMVVQIYQHLREHGRVIRGYLGVRTEDVVPVVGQESGGEPEEGARVVSVLAGSPAADAGLLTGDIVVEYNGQAVDSRNKLQFLIAGSTPGEEVKCEFYRDGGKRSILVSPVEWIDKQTSGEASEARNWLGMNTADLDGGDPKVTRLKDMLGVTATTGVMVVSVQENQPAADAGISPGDVIVSIDGHEISDMASYEEVRNLMVARTDPLTILVRTGGTENYVTVAPRSGGIEN
jgi:serine protease Do